MRRAGDTTEVGLAVAAVAALAGARARVRRMLTATLAGGLALLGSLTLALPARAETAVARVEITSPNGGGAYEQGEAVPTSFSCEALGSYTLESCEDSTGHSGSSGALSTELAGVQTYTVTATVNGGLKARASIEYTVYQLLSAGTTKCTGPSAGTGKEVIVVERAHCTLLAGTVVTGNVRVEALGALNDEGASIGGSLVAVSPESLLVGAPGTSTVGGSIEITKLTGGPLGGENAICNAVIHGNLLVSGSLAHARPLLIGGTPECAPDVVHSQVNVLDSAAPVYLTGDQMEQGVVKDNTAAVEVDEDTLTGALAVSANRGRTALRRNHLKGSLTVQSNGGSVLAEEDVIGQNLLVQGNTGGVQLDGNDVTRNAVCSGNRPAATGTANVVGEHNLGCPV